MTAIRDKVHELIAKETSVPADRLTPAATLRDLDIESLDVVEIIYGIEEHFGIHLPYDNPGFDIETVGGLVDTVERLVREKEQAAVAS